MDYMDFGRSHESNVPNKKKKKKKRRRLGKKARKVARLTKRLYPKALQMHAIMSQQARARDLAQLSLMDFNPEGRLTRTGPYQGPRKIFPTFGKASRFAKDKQAETPGPGEYPEHREIGKPMGSSGMRISFSFRNSDTCGHLSRMDTTPGPNHYELPPTDTGPSLSFLGHVPPSKRYDEPGPGHYNIRHIAEKRGPAFSFSAGGGLYGTRFMSGARETKFSTPGPGAYEVNTDLIDPKRGQTIAVPLKQTQLESATADVPFHLSPFHGAMGQQSIYGAGASISSSGPAYSMGRRTATWQTLARERAGDTPGPGTYEMKSSISAPILPLPGSEHFRKKRGKKDRLLEQRRRGGGGGEGEPRTIDWQLRSPPQNSHYGGVAYTDDELSPEFDRHQRQQQQQLHRRRNNYHHNNDSPNNNYYHDDVNRENDRDRVSHQFRQASSVHDY